jgi:hypothetical protein
MPATQINLILEYCFATKKALFITVPIQDVKKLLLPLKKGIYCWTTHQHYLGERGPIIQVQLQNDGSFAGCILKVIN